MKKFILAASVVGMFAATATPALAYTMVNGQKVFGYDRNGTAPAQRNFVYDAPVTPVMAVTGNTRVYDMSKALLPQDRQSFIDMIKRTGLSY